MKKLKLKNIRRRLLQYSRSKYDFKKILFFIFFVFVFSINFIYCESQIDLGVGYSKNISEKKGVDLLYSYDGFLNFNLSFKYFKDEKKTTSNNGFFLINYNPAINKIWSMWLFERISYDRIQRINAENHVGAGVKYIIKDTEKVSFDESLGFLYDVVEYEGGENKNKIRISNRLRFKLIPFDKLEISLNIFYQPDISNFKDYIITSNFYISYLISERISIKFKLDDNYRSYTLSNYYNDLYTNLALSFKF